MGYDPYGLEPDAPEPDLIGPSMCGDFAECHDDDNPCGCPTEPKGKGGMTFADKMLTVAIYADMGGGLRVVHEACGGSLIEDYAEVRWWPEITQAVDAHRCGGV